MDNVCGREANFLADLAQRVAMEKRQNVWRDSTLIDGEFCRKQFGMPTLPHPTPAPPHPTPPHRTPSHLIPSHPIPSHPIPYSTLIGWPICGADALLKWLSGKSSRITALPCSRCKPTRARSENGSQHAPKRRAAPWMMGT